MISCRERFWKNIAEYLLLVLDFRHPWGSGQGGVALVDETSPSKLQLLD